MRGFYIGGSKTTPAPKQQLEVVGTTGRLIMVSDGGTLYRGEEPEPLAPPTWPVEGIPAGIHELIAAMDQGIESSFAGASGSHCSRTDYWVFRIAKAGECAGAYPGA